MASSRRRSYSKKPTKRVRFNLSRSKGKNSKSKGKRKQKKSRGRRKTLRGG